MSNYYENLTTSTNTEESDVFSKLSITNSERHPKRREQNIPATSFGHIPNWYETLPLLLSECLNHKWLRTFQRHFLSARVENFASIDDDDAAYLLQHDSVVPNVLGLHIEPCSYDEDHESEDTKAVRCRTIHVTRPDGLQLIFDVYRQRLEQDMRDLLCDPDINFVIYDSKNVDEIFSTILPDAVPNVMDIKPIIDIIKHTESTILGKIIPFEADLDTILRTVTGQGYFFQNTGSYPTSSVLRGIMALDLCALFELKYTNLSHIRNLYFSKTGKFVKLPRNLLWQPEQDTEPITVSSLSSSSDEPGCSGNVVKTNFLPVTQTTFPTNECWIRRSRREPLLPLPPSRLNAGFKPITKMPPKRQGPDLTYPECLRPVKFDHFRGSWIQVGNNAQPLKPMINFLQRQ